MGDPGGRVTQVGRVLRPSLPSLAGFVGASGERRVLVGFAGLVARAARPFGLGSLGPLGPGARLARDGSRGIWGWLWFSGGVANYGERINFCFSRVFCWFIARLSLYGILRLS